MTKIIYNRNSRLGTFKILSKSVEEPSSRNRVMEANVSEEDGLQKTFSDVLAQRMRCARPKVLRSYRIVEARIVPLSMDI